MTDPLADWWVHEVKIARPSTGADGYGGQYAEPQTVSGFVNDRAKLVRNPAGDQVVSSTQVALPRDVGYVPVGSLVTLPAAFGPAGGPLRTSPVIGSSVGDGGGQPTPDHVVVYLE